MIIEDKIILKTKKDVVLTHLYVKSKQFQVNISEGVKELLYHLYDMGGIESENDFDEFVKTCIKYTPIRTKHSVRNTISECVGMNIIKNTGKYQKSISEEWLPKECPNSIGLDYKIMNAVQEGNII